MRHIRKEEIKKSMREDLLKLLRRLKISKDVLDRYIYNLFPSAENLYLVIGMYLSRYSFNISIFK